SSRLDISYMFSGVEFFPAYFLEVFAFLSFALMLGIFVQRSGLSIILLLNSYLIELIIKENIDDYVPWMIKFFPLESIMNLMPIPFDRYVFQQIHDYVSLEAVGIALLWTLLFNYFKYMRLKKTDTLLQQSIIYGFILKYFDFITNVPFSCIVHLRENQPNY